MLRSTGMDAALERLVELGGASGSVRSVLLQAAFAYIRDVGGDSVDIEALADALTMAAGPYRSAGEIAGYGLEGLIAWCLEQVPAEPPPKPHYPAKGLPANEAAAALRREMAGAVGAAVAWRAIAEVEPVADGLDFNGPPPPPRVGFKAGPVSARRVPHWSRSRRSPASSRCTSRSTYPIIRWPKNWRIAGPGLLRTTASGRSVSARTWHTDNPERALCQKARLAEQVAKAGLNVMGYTMPPERQGW